MALKCFFLYLLLIAISFPKKGWQVKGSSKLLPKGDDTCVMILAICDEIQRFGSPFTESEHGAINANRALHSKHPIVVDDQCPSIATPGFIF